ncbi:[citrate (pro-3S)-lyase] ligase [Kallipyga massiliensis]|uniref:[citrate (pro-3S)-lyase] ligase n=1 Tax=Kallipyga massiliensis TaxID=1472764 RepID=UPI0026EA98A4|nr:[citrate (pro-3S)-lyase] ligase [Kallipyga massiliensis]
MRTLWVKESAYDRKAWEGLLEKVGIRPEKSINRTLGLFEGETLVGSVSRLDNIIKCVAVDPDHRGGSVFNALLSQMIQEIYHAGYDRLYVYTKPESVRAFEALSFQEIERVGEDLVFLERAEEGFPAYLEGLRKWKGKTQRGDEKEVAAIVMNANPFTRGHLALVEAARASSDVLYLFAVSDPSSVFPFDVRKRLMEEGVAHLDRVHVLTTESYMVSRAVFPSYFLKEADQATAIQARLDAKIFKNHIAPALGISLRFVGEEPFSPATRTYNEQMEAIFAGPPNPGKPRLDIIPRLEEGGEAISASTVRKMLAQGQFEEAKRLLPPSSQAFLDSPEARPILEALKKDPLQGIKEADVQKLVDEVRYE